MQSVNTKNWTYSRYIKDQFMALITFGANPETIDKGELEYYVTVLEDELTEVFQASFQSLPEACIFLNQKYSDWNFEDQTAPKSGCSTCAAH